MASSSSGGGVPPGFRFHPTDEELLHFYLKKKISFQKFDMEVIREVDLNKIEPWDLQERCKIGSTPQNEWYFFSHKDRKYPTGSRTNRATNAGFWKATGRDKCIRNTFKKIGMRKTLVFYRGRAPHGQKTDWIMHEYRLEDADTDPLATHEDGWVICRVFKKKNLFKIGGNTTTGSEGGGGVHHNNGMMTMMANSEGQFNMNTTTSAFTHNQYFMQRHHDHDHHHNHDLNYISHIPPINHHQYPQLEPQDFISNSDHHIMKPLMLSTSASNYDHQTMIANPMQVKQFMSTNREDCDEISASPTAAGYQPGIDEHDQSSDQGVVVGGVRSDDQSHLNDWDRIVLNTTNSHHHHNQGAPPKELGFQEANPNTSSMSQINQLSLRSEMDFWGYGK